MSEFVEYLESERYRLFWDRVNGESVESMRTKRTRGATLDQLLTWLACTIDVPSVLAQGWDWRLEIA